MCLQYGFVAASSESSRGHQLIVVSGMINVFCITLGRSFVMLLSLPSKSKFDCRWKKGCAYLKFEPRVLIRFFFFFWC